MRHPKRYASLLRRLGRGSLEKRLFLQLIHPGDVVFDIGANQGDFTGLFSDLAGDQGTVFAFEPGPQTFRTLTDASAGRVNVRLRNMAISDVAGTARLLQPGADHGQASLRRQSAGSWSRGGTVEAFDCVVSTVDDCARELTRLDFLKCDVEGAELLVLRGARETLDRLSPILFLEVHDEWTRAFDYTPADLLDALIDAGYTSIYLVDEGVRPIHPGTAITGPANLLCGKPGRLPEARGLA